MGLEWERPARAYQLPPSALDDPRVRQLLQADFNDTLALVQTPLAKQPPEDSEAARALAAARQHALHLARLLHGPGATLEQFESKIFCGPPTEMPPWEASPRADEGEREAVRSRVGPGAYDGHVSCGHVDTHAQHQLAWPAALSMRQLPPLRHRNRYIRQPSAGNHQPSVHGVTWRARFQQ